MLSHRLIWQALDRLAADNGLSPSGLARKAGLDATAFNRSKRVSSDGRLRWPSTESLAKVLSATGASLADLVAMIEGEGAHTRPVPVIGMAQAGHGGFFDDAGFPTGAGWDEIAFPDIGDEHAYALEVTGDSMVPVYRDGDIVIVSPEASVRRGDRVVVKTRDGEVMAKILKRRSAKVVELASLNPEHEDRAVPAPDLVWVARIVWASQ